VVKMTGASPPRRIHMPMVSRLSEQSPIINPNADIPPSRNENVRTFMLNEGAEEELFGMPAFQYLEALP